MYMFVCIFMHCVCANVNVCICKYVCTRSMYVYMYACMYVCIYDVYNINSEDNKDGYRGGRVQLLHVHKQRQTHKNTQNEADL